MLCPCFMQAFLRGRLESQTVNCNCNLKSVKSNKIEKGYIIKYCIWNVKLNDRMQTGEKLHYKNHTEWIITGNTSSSNFSWTAWVRVRVMISLSLALTRSVLKSCHVESIIGELKGVWKKETKINIFASIHYKQFLNESGLFILEEEAWTWI